jgi:DNA-binding LacI/PurR family transcriptional regulator
MRSKATISDIAKLADVSKTTVSFYLNGKYGKMSEATRSKIEEAVAKTNYLEEEQKTQRNDARNHLIGVIIGDITSPFANHIVKGLADYCSAKDYHLMLGFSDYQLENERHCIDSMNQMGVSGYIVQPTAQFETMWEGMQIKKPIVYFDSPNHNTKGLWVKTNNYEAAYNAVSFLIKKGYQHFVLVTADPSKIVTRQERCRGFVDHLEIEHMPYDVIVANKETAIDELREQLELYLKAKDVCIYATSNWLLNKVHMALEPYADRIPDEIGLLGMDSYEWSRLVVPSITTIVQPAYEEGTVAAKILIDKIEGTNLEPPNQILKSRIDELESTDHKKTEM